jgi:hypothetical protein
MYVFNKGAEPGPNWVWPNPLKPITHEWRGHVTYAPSLVPKDDQNPDWAVELILTKSPEILFGIELVDDEPHGFTIEADYMSKALKVAATEGSYICVRRYDNGQIPGEEVAFADLELSINRETATQQDRDDAYEAADALYKGILWE